MLDKLKKTLGRRKPLGTIEVPNAKVHVVQPALPDQKAVMKNRLNNALSDPHTLEQFYREMLSSRGTSEFAKSQMGQLPEATKKELVRMWLMSMPENDIKEKVDSGPDVARKRAFSETSTGSSSEEESRRQKAMSRDGLPDIVSQDKESRPSRDDHNAQTTSKVEASTDKKTYNRRSVMSFYDHERPSTTSSSSSLASSSSSDTITKKWVDEVKHMHEVVTSRKDYDPKTTKDMGFEKMIIQVRLFLRAESITRLRRFIDTGGLAGLVSIVTGILDVEWREQHETRFLLGILHCIRIILKTHEGASRFFALEQHEELFPALVRMQFSWGEERRAFFRFDHRAVITEIFYYWVHNVNAKDSTLEQRANRMLQYLQDFTDKEKAQHDFIAAMSKPRHYKNWHKEVKNTTQPWLGTPWMYYHKENVLQAREQEHSECERPFSEEFAPTRRPELVSSTVRSHTETLVAHYVAANLDLMNICIVAQPEKSKRNALRQEFADCGFEDLFGRKLRLASQVNFPCIESALRDWVTAAKADNWPVAHVTALPDDLQPGSGSRLESHSASLTRCLLKFDVLEDTPFDL